MSLLGLSSKTAADGSPLETGVFRAQQADVELRRIARREWWLWFSALAVTVLCISALVLSFYKPFFLRTEQHFYDIQPDQARWGTAALLALFNSWMLYRQWFFRRQRRNANHQNPQASQDENGFSDNPTGMDPVTGMYTRASIEPHLGKEIGRAKRQNTPLSIATLHLDDFDQIAERYGQAMSDLVLKEFVRRFKRAIRGSDYAVRLGTADFALVLPECSLDQVKNTLSRIGPLEVSASGKKISVTYSTGWVDYQRGNLPGDLIKRATEILHLYDRAAKDSSTAATSVR
jgi:diguanylate cyclase (GGDEF)-like protein